MRSSVHLLVLGMLCATMWTGCRSAGPGELIVPDTTVRDTARIIYPDEVIAASGRFGTKEIFTDNQLQTITGDYRTANDFIGRPVTLSYTFMAPASDTMSHRPFVLMIHEGAFIFGSQADELAKARFLARKGYAVACINYRIGFNGGSQSNACGGNSMEIVQAVYRAVQDTYAALHFFAAKSDAYGIDPGQMILAGSSAGAITVSAFAYMRELEFESLQTGIIRTLGRLDPDPQGSPFNVRALLTNLGYGIFNSGYINEKNAMPTLFFQRTGDDVLPYNKANLFFCPFYLTSEGALPVSRLLKSLGKPYELNYQEATGHQHTYPDEYVADRYAQFMKRFWGKNLRQIINKDYTTVENVGLP